MIYLAVPIADPDPAVVKYRVETATRIGVSAERREAAKLGIPVFYMLGIGTERGIAEGTEKLIRAWGLEIAARA